MTAQEVLIAARKLIEKPEAWTQSAYARTRTGNTIWYGASSAVCFCSAGAVLRASGDNRGLEAKACDYLAMTTGTDRLIGWNDFANRTHPEVLAAFDRAIELAGATQ